MGDTKHFSHDAELSPVLPHSFFLSHTPTCPSTHTHPPCTAFSVVRLWRFSPWHYSLYILPSAAFFNLKHCKWKLNMAYCNTNLLCSYISSFPWVTIWKLNSNFPLEYRSCDLLMLSGKSNWYDGYISSYFLKQFWVHWDLKNHYCICLISTVGCIHNLK